MSSERTRHELTRVHGTEGIRCAVCSRTISSAIYTLSDAEGDRAEGMTICADCIALGVAVLAEVEAALRYINRPCAFKLAYSENAQFLAAALEEMLARATAATAAITKGETGHEHDR